MREFRTGSSRVLITTDLLARGIGEYFSFSNAEQRLMSLSNLESVYDGFL